MAHLVKNLPAVQRPGFDPWVRKMPWRIAWLSTPVFLPGESHWQRSPAGYSLWGCKSQARLNHHHINNFICSWILLAYFLLRTFCVYIHKEFYIFSLFFVLSLSGVIQMSQRWPLCISPLGCLFLHCRLRPISSKADLHQTQIFTHLISSYLKNSPSKQTLGHLGLLCFAYPMKPNLASAGLW